MEKSVAKKLQESLTHKWDNVWEVIDENEMKLVVNLNEKYKDLLDKCKTERESARKIVRLDKENSYISIDELREKSIKPSPGTKVYAINKDKAVVLLVIGK